MTNFPVTSVVMHVRLAPVLETRIAVDASSLSALSRSSSSAEVKAAMMSLAHGAIFRMYASLEAEGLQRLASLYGFSMVPQLLYHRPAYWKQEICQSFFPFIEFGCYNSEE